MDEFYKTWFIYVALEEAQSGDVVFNMTTHDVKRVFAVKEGLVTLGYLSDDLKSFECDDPITKEEFINKYKDYEIARLRVYPDLQIKINN